MANAKRGSISNNLFEDDINDDVHSQETDSQTDEQDDRRKSPCFRKKCYRGEECQVNDKEEAECVCTPSCDFYKQQEGRHQVCSNKNVTYDTECDLDREHCLCKHSKDGCRYPGARKIQLEYYGTCQELSPCSDDSRVQFPDRLRNWLFVVMETMADRAEIGEYEDLLEEAKADDNHSYAAVWGFCDLDKDPQDRHVSRRELQYTVRSLKVMEHCLVPFLDECDHDDDRKITLVEWARCLSVPEDKIENRCRDIQTKRGKKSRK